MMVSFNFVAEDVAEQWRTSMDRLLEAGNRALGVGWDPADEPGVDDPYLNHFDEAAATYRRTTELVLTSKTEDTRSPQSLALLGGLEVVDLLLSAPGTTASSQAQERAVRGWNTTMDKYVNAMTGHGRASVTVPASIGTKLGALEKVGAEELVALARNEVVWRPLVGFGSGIVAFGGAAVKRAFDAVSAVLNAFQQRVVSLMQWIIERLRRLMPTNFKQLLDAQLAWLQEAINHEAADRVAEVIGHVLGKHSAEAACRDFLAGGWESARVARDLDAVVAEHLVRIEHVGEIHQRVESISVKLTAWATPSVPQVRVVVGATAMTHFALVMYQVFEGFDDVRRLAMGATPALGRGPGRVVPAGGPGFW